MLAPGLAMAATSGAGESGFPYNPVLFGLLSIVLVLMIAIVILAVVLYQLVFAYRDNLRKERKGGKLLKAASMLLFMATVPVLSYAETGGEAASAPTAFIGGMPAWDFYLITGFIFFQLLIIFVLLGLVFRMVRVLRNAPEKQTLIKKLARLNWLDFFNKSVPVKEESAILLDHDYDGIHELDNSLPPWWKWGFAFTICFAIVYMWYYQVAGGPSQVDEYNVAVARAESEKLAYLAKAGNIVDENNVTLITDAGRLANAKELFQNTCAACHGGNGGGGVGPNLTDDYWMHGNTLQDVFKSIKYGWKDKGMPEWGHNLSASQIADLSSYIKMLRGTKPAGAKAPQGELMQETEEKSNEQHPAEKADQQAVEANKG